MTTRQEIITFCHLCCGRCSRKGIIEDGKLVSWERDTESGLPTEWCPYTKGKAIMEIQPHPDRLKYPLKRVGAKGEGKWQRVSWDEALDTIAKKLLELKAKYGPESVAVGLGEPKGMEFAFGQRFATAFGTPNVSTPGNICGGPSLAASVFTFGTNVVPDEEHLPKLLVLWGCNPIHTSGGLRRESFRQILLEGGKLIVIDPKQIDIAKRADLWIRLRPGSDGALAMGILKAMVEGKLYNQEFVQKWTLGFDKLEEHVKTFSFEDVEKVTWVPRHQIEEFARLYSQTSPASIMWGNSLENILESMQSCRAISLIRGITGNVNIPGGDVFITPAPYTRPGTFMLLGKLPRKPERTLGNEYKWAMKTAYIPPQTLNKAILEGKPYPVKAALFFLTNPLSTYPNALEVYKAYMQLELLVIADVFMNPTAAISDFVLPAATGMEHDAVGYWPGWYGDIRAYPKYVEPPGEAWSDAKIINELAKRVGLKEYFWEDEEEALDYMLKPAGVTWEQFKKIRILKAKREYKKPEEGAFKTASGKVELYSKDLQAMGYSPMPRWEELSKFHFDISKEFPLLLTNFKEEVYVLSGYRQVSHLRKAKPDPIVEMNPETAKKLGLKEGEWVYIETKLGRIKQKLALDPSLDPRVVYASLGWYFPEESTNQYEWAKSNLNVLIPNDPAETATGSVEMRGIPCRVYKDHD